MYLCVYLVEVALEEAVNVIRPVVGGAAAIWFKVLQMFRLFRHSWLR